MRKTILGAVFFWSFLILSVLISSGKVFAAGAYEGCVPIYGGGVQCPTPPNMLVNKSVRNPATGVFVDNLGPTDPKYRPGSIVVFRIVVQNIGDQELTNVTVTDRFDKFPQIINLISGPGTIDNTNKTIAFTINKISGNTTQQFEVKGVVSTDESKFPNASVFCPVNIVDAKADNGQTGHDEAQFCIEKKPVVPVTPQAGPEHWLLTLVGFASTLTVGMYLRKRTLVG